MPRARESQRETSRARYADYGRMCAELGVKHAGPNWCSHYAELRRGDGVFVRLTRAQCIAWWRERFSDSELRAMGSAIDFLTVEEGGSGF